MVKPDGRLTGTQLEIMEVVWAGEGPVKVSHIWHVLSRERKLARTTVLTMVQRLEKRGWLKRSAKTTANAKDRVVRYRASCSRQDAAGRLAAFRLTGKG